MTASSAPVLDSSALLAVLHSESGAGNVLPVLDGCIISAVNWAEVVQKSAARGVGVSALALRSDVQALGVAIVPFDIADAEAAGELWRQTRSAGLCLAARACLVLAKRTGRTALTADRQWAELSLGISIEMIR